MQATSSMKDTEMELDIFYPMSPTPREKEREKERVREGGRRVCSSHIMVCYCAILPDPLQESPGWKEEGKRRKRRTRSQDREKTRQQLQYGHSHVTHTNTWSWFTM